MYGPLASRTKSGVVPTLFRALTGELTPPGIICFACSKAAAEFFLSFMFLLFGGTSDGIAGNGDERGTWFFFFFCLLSFFFSSFPLFLFSSFPLFLFSSLSYFKVPLCCFFYNLLGVIGDDVLGAGTLDGDEALECYTALVEIAELGGGLEH